MSKHWKTLLAAVVLAGGASSVAIADGYEPAGKGLVAPAPARKAYAWDGLYVGIGGGAQSTGLSLNGTLRRTNPIGTTFVEKFRASDDEWQGFGTVLTGYDQVLAPGILVGAFADFDFGGDTGFAMSEEASGPVLDGTIKENLELDTVWSVGLRLGFLLTPQMLIYANGGYTEARLDGTVTLQQMANPPVTKDFFPDDLHGYFVGGGTEYMFYQTQNNRGGFSLKLEYRYADYDSESVEASFQVAAGASGLVTDTDIVDIDSIHSIRAALVWKLGHY